MAARPLVCAESAGGADSGTRTQGRPRRFAVYAALAIAFCLATLADRPDPARLLFYLGGAVTLFGFLLQRTAVLAAPWDNT